MSQLPLFAAREAIPRRPPDPAFIRKHLLRLLRIVRAADRLPWSEPETRNWEKLFPELSQVLPPEEGAQLRADFAAEVARLRKAA